MSRTDLTPHRLLDKWVDHRAAKTAPALPETLVRRVRWELAAHSWTIQGLPDDATQETPSALNLRRSRRAPADSDGSTRPEHAQSNELPRQ